MALTRDLDTLTIESKKATAAAAAAESKQATAAAAAAAMAAATAAALAEVKRSAAAGAARLATYPSPDAANKLAPKPADLTRSARRRPWKPPSIASRPRGFQNWSFGQKVAQLRARQKADKIRACVNSLPTAASGTAAVLAGGAGAAAGGTDAVSGGADDAASAAGGAGAEAGGEAAAAADAAAEAGGGVAACRSPVKVGGDAITVTTPPGTLQERFVKYVMCGFTPRRPNELPMSDWVSCDELIGLLRPYAPEEVRNLSSETLKQLITEWYKDDPAFADQPFYAWCKKLKDNNAPRSDPRQGHRNRSQHFKFPFQRTSHRAE